MQRGRFQETRPNDDIQSALHNTVKQANQASRLKREWLRSKAGNPIKIGLYLFQPGAP